VVPPPPRVEPKPEVKPEPVPKKEPEPEPEKPKVKKEAVKPEPEPVKKDPTKPADTKRKPAKEPKTPEVPVKPKQGPVVNLRETKRSNVDLKKQQEEAAAAQADQAAKAAEAFESRKGQVLSAFTTRAASLTTENIGLSAIDTGTVGISYASYNDWVKKVYWDAWQPPNDLPPGDSTVTVRVTIRKDGSVASASVTDPSGVSKLDDNIRKLLARVKTIGKPFPDGAREETRTYNIDFNLKAKLGAG
jgi:TonB family protein